MLRQFVVNVNAIAWVYLLSHLPIPIENNLHTNCSEFVAFYLYFYSISTLPHFLELIFANISLMMNDKLSKFEVVPRISSQRLYS